MDSEQMRSRIASRSDELRRVREELKNELFGIDDIIDRVIEAVRAWYVLPEIVRRPVIVCLWGLTGTGKTQLVRSLARKLGFYDRFLEVQMDGFSHGSGYRRSSISSMLGDSGIDEGQPGILMLDEFQRFRTINDKGADIAVQRYQDVWALLSDGRLPPLLAFMNDLEESLAQVDYDREREEEGDEAKRALAARVRLRLTPWEARDLKQTLKLEEPIMEIMGWGPDEVRARMQAFREQPDRWGTDYSKLLVFVAGNLDEMYNYIATRVEDCDTDADIFHRYTRRLSLVDVKKALGKRFKPEQIARLGNNHVIYPSLSRATYERLIADLCKRYAQEVETSSGLKIEIDPAVRAEIYANAVFPAQGTRPVFSSVQGLLAATLVDASVWAYEQGAAAGDVVHIGISDDRRHLRATWRERTHAFRASFEVHRLKQRTQHDFRALLAVHEAGHAVLYALLLKLVPLEVKINVASFDGGYNSFLPLRAKSRQDMLDMICVGLGGRAAETLVFGPNACTTGAEEDLRQATQDAAHFVRVHGFSGRLTRVDVGRDADCDVNTAIDETNAPMEALVSAQFSRAMSLLQHHARELADIARLLVQQGEIPRARLAEIFGLKLTEEPAVLAPYAQRLASFAEKLATVELELSQAEERA